MLFRTRLEEPWDRDQRDRSLEPIEHLGWSSLAETDFSMNPSSIRQAAAGIEHGRPGWRHDPIQSVKNSRVIARPVRLSAISASNRQAAALRNMSAMGLSNQADRDSSQTSEAGTGRLLKLRGGLNTYRSRVQQLPPVQVPIARSLEVAGSEVMAGLG